jgi:polysaccharide pyruvyl transferase WcaK-like protein
MKEGIERSGMCSTNGKTMKIGLLDHMGYGNLGDAATQDVAIANIKKRLPGAQLVGFSFVPSDTTMRHGIPCYPIRWWYPRVAMTGNQAADPEKANLKLKSALKSIPLVYSCAKPVLDFVREALFWARSYKAVRRLDLLIISGGGQLSDFWRGPWSHPYAIFKFCLLTKVAGKKLYILNVGAGPLNHRLSRLFAKCAVQLADYRSFRDDESQKLLRSLGVKAETHVYPDLVYALEIEELLKSAPPVSSIPVVGINPIGFCDPRSWSRKDGAVYQEYLKKMACFSMWLLEHGYKLRIFTNEASLDQYVMEDLKTELHSRVAPDLFGLISWGASETVKDVLQEMSEFAFVVTSKYHGIIFSHVLGKPVISLSYGKKMDFAMQAVGQDRFNANIERFDVDWLIKAFRSLVDDSEEIKQESAAAVRANAAKLSQQFDSLFLPGRP